MGFFSNLFGGARPDPVAIKAALDAGGSLVDVRSPSEFAGKHLPGALNIPHGEIGASVGRLGPKDRPVVLYCRSGARSAVAARALRGAGFETVIDVGPMSAFPAGLL